MKIEGLVFNCTVVTHDYTELIEQTVEVLNEDVLGDGEWVLVKHRDIPYIVNSGDIEIDN